MRYSIIQALNGFWYLFDDNDNLPLYERKTVQEIIALLPEDCR